MNNFSDKTFAFTSYTFDPATGRVVLLYHLDDLKFEEVITIPLDDVDM